MDLTRAALRNPSVRQVVGGFAGVTLGEWVLGTTVAIHAYAVGGALAVGFVGFRFAPAALAGLWTTQLAEHPRRQRILTLTAATRAGATGLATLALALNFPIAIVIALVWLDAAAGSAYRPTQAALLPAISRTPGELTATTALASNVKSSGQIIGALLGGVLVATVPIAVAVGAAAALYLASVASTARVRDARATSIVAGRLRVGLAGLRAGTAIIRADPETRAIVLHACLRSLVRGLWITLAVVASLRLLSLGNSGLGVLMAAAGLGALAAIIAAAMLAGNQRLAGWFAFGLLLCGLPVAAVGIVSSPTPAIAFMVVWGIGMSLSDVGAQTLLNRIVPAMSIGRVTGAMESGKLTLEGFGSLMGPALLAVMGIRGALVVAGGVLPVVVLFGYPAFRRIDDRAVTRVGVLELLRRVPFFGPLRVDALEGVAARLQLERHPAGTDIVRQGDLDASRWYLVGEGELVVEVDGFLVGELHHGDQFGERGLLRGVRRSATVRARTDVLLYTLEREDFLAAVAGPDLDETDGISVPEQVTQVDPATALARAPLLQGIGVAALADLGRRTRIDDVAAGAPIVVRGAIDDCYHVLLSGRAEVIVDDAVRRELLPGDAFGEIAVLHRVPRTATVIAADPSTVLTLDGEAVRSAVRTNGGEIAALAS